MRGDTQVGRTCWLRYANGLVAASGDGKSVSGSWRTWPGCGENLRDTPPY